MQLPRALVFAILAFGAVDLGVAAAAVIELGRARAAAHTVDRRAAELASGQILRNVDDLLIRTLANSSARTGDREIEALLARNDVTFRVTAPVPPPAPSRTAAPPPSPSPSPVPPRP